MFHFANDVRCSYKFWLLFEMQSVTLPSNAASLKSVETFKWIHLRGRTNVLLVSKIKLRWTGATKHGHAHRTLVTLVLRKSFYNTATAANLTNVHTAFQLGFTAGKSSWCTDSHETPCIIQVRNKTLRDNDISVHAYSYYIIHLNDI